MSNPNTPEEADHHTASLDRVAKRLGIICNGSLTYASDHGTTLTITIPKGGNAWNILIVDDKQLAINALCRILRDVEPDSTCMKALSAQQALDEASRTHFDVVFLDIEMPGMNGIELAQKLKAGNEGINIIFVTAHAEHALEDTACTSVDSC